MDHVSTDHVSTNPVDTEALALEIAKLASFQNASDYQMLTYIREFDEHNGWYIQGATSCAQWLSWRIGWGLKASHERLRVAKALVKLPKISEAFKDGRLSYSKVRSMSRVANPKNEEYLLNVGLNGTAVHVDQLVREVRRAEMAENVRLSHVRFESRSLVTYTDNNGMTVVRAVLPPEDGERFVKVLDAFRVDDPPPPTPEEYEAAPAEAVRARPQPFAQRNADALLTMAEVAAKNDVAASSADRYQVVLHVDAESAAFEDGSEATDVALTRILCDSSEVVVKEDEHGDPLHIGRKTRRISPALRRALKRRDPGCQFPGCTHTRYLHGHHVKHWAHGGRTDIDNLVHLCSRHHHYVHEGMFEVRPDGSGWQFFTPDGTQVHQAGKLAPMNVDLEKAILRWTDANDLHLTERTSLTGWRGERMDYGIAVDGVMGYGP